MQVTMNFEKQFVDALQKEFSTPNVKDALYQLLEFYKKSSTELQKDLETIEASDGDYGYIEDARKRRENGEETYTLDNVLKEFE